MGVGFCIVREGGPRGLRSHDRVLSDRVERALPGVRRLARGARPAGSRYVSRGYAPDIPRTSKAVWDVAPTYKLTLSGSIDICLRQLVQVHPLRIADRQSTRLNSSHYCASRMPSSPGNNNL